MVTIKSYTDIEQSKKLAEILPFESADMYYSKHDTIYADTLYCSCDINFFYIRGYTPCWSLVALLSVIPKRIKHYNVLTIDVNENEFAIRYDEIAYCVNKDLPDITKDNPVDACYNMILKLRELKIL